MEHRASRAVCVLLCVVALGSCGPRSASLSGSADADGGRDLLCDGDAFGLFGCGECGDGCPPRANAVFACMAGACGIAACDPGHFDCNGLAVDGCEAEVGADPMNCGRCGAQCSVVVNAAARCVDGLCTIDPAGGCDPGYGDCDGIPGNGCEATLATDRVNCGVCGHVCPSPDPGLNQLAVCMGGQCGVGACAAGFTDCNHLPADGCETATDADLVNCGACGHLCAPLDPWLHRIPACLHGQCGSGGCAPGFADCNLLPGDGCEANLTSPLTCGSCAKSCSAPPNEDVACLNGQCAPPICLYGYGDCNHLAADGCEKEVLDDAVNCGACGNVCMGVPGPNQQLCLGGRCGLFCVAGFADCDGNPANGCEQDVSAGTYNPNLQVVLNCGSCGTNCTRHGLHSAGAVPACINGACSYRCLPGWDSCDFMFSGTRCNNDLQMDSNNCGACGQACPVNHPNCQQGVCQ